MSYFTQLLEFDTNLLIQARSITPESFSPLLQMCGETVVIATACFLLILWIIGVYKKRDTEKHQALSIFLTIVMVFIFYAILNFCIPQWRPNPQEVVHGIKALIPHPLDNSFPSGHALFTGALLVGIYRYIHRWDILSIAIVLGLITTISRVLAGIHYP
jgi:membrane-associated phospholipid phosphatase